MSQSSMQICRERCKLFDGQSGLCVLLQLMAAGTACHRHLEHNVHVSALAMSWTRLKSCASAGSEATNTSREIGLT